MILFKWLYLFFLWTMEGYTYPLGSASIPESIDRFYSRSQYISNLHPMLVGAQRWSGYRYPQWHQWLHKQHHTIGPSLIIILILMHTAAATSLEKSTWPGESIRLMIYLVNHEMITSSHIRLLLDIIMDLVVLSNAVVADLILVKQCDGTWFHSDSTFLLFFTIHNDKNHQKQLKWSYDQL